jgi:hypothetical protein
MLLKPIYPDTPANYSEIAQKYPCKFAFAKIEGNNVRVLHGPVKCRDFLLDTLMWIKNVVPLPTMTEYDEELEEYVEVSGGVGDVFGYNFAGPIVEDKTVLFVEDLPNLEKHKELFNDLLMVQMCGMEPCRFIKTTEKDTYVIVGDKRWMDTCLLFSVYTFLIRNVFFPEKPDYEFGRFDVFVRLKDLLALPRNTVNTVKVCDKMDPEEYHSNNGFYAYLLTPKLTVYYA